jgi:hypothetical protein
MDAILNPKAMAGSPDADLANARTASCGVAHGFCVSGAVLREPMKEIQDV